MKSVLQFLYLTALLSELFLSFSSAEVLFNHIKNIRPITNSDLLTINNDHSMKRDPSHIASHTLQQSQPQTDDHNYITDPFIAINAPSKEDNDNDPKKQKLTIIGYASDAVPAKNLIDFSQRYDLDFHLIGTDKEWGGFNTKITGFYDFISEIDNSHNDSIILILDAYDTVPICTEQGFLDKFQEFDADIVIATGKDCWPDPNLEAYLTNRMTDEFKEAHPWFPWYLCPNSGAMMGYQNAMLSMLTRVRELVREGNGSCNDFEGNAFSRHTQSDQRCYTSYYVDLLRHQDMKQQISAAKMEGIATGSGSGIGGDVIDISVLNEDNTVAILHAQEDDDGNTNGRRGSNMPHYTNIKMVLDHTNALFASMGGMMFSNYYVAMNGSHNGDDGAQVVIVENKITEARSCVLHGNGPGVILWRSFVKQIRHDGQLYVDDHVLRIGSDFFHFVLWWMIMPCERLSHWMSIKYHVDLGVHSTTFSEDAVWHLHFVAVALFCTIAGVPVLCWYKYKHKADKKRRHKSISFPLSSSVGNSEIGNHLKKQLLNLEIMVHHNGTSFSLLKTEKKN